MPGTPRALFFLLQELKELKAARRWLAPGPVYAAAGMVLVTAILMLSVISSLKNPAVGPAADAKTRITAVSTTPAAAENPSPGVSAPDAQSGITAAGPPPAAAGNEQPCRPVIGQIKLGFGWQLNPVYHDWRYQTGVDIEAPPKAAVKALYGGEVKSVNGEGNAGMTVIIQSGSRTVYYGALAAAAVKKGDHVTAGDKVGEVGPDFHLHLAVKDGDQYVDPEEFLNKAR